jgi:hypothetical protein
MEINFLQGSSASNLIPKREAWFHLGIADSNVTIQGVGLKLIVLQK